jgi:hypothetical protein
VSSVTSTQRARIAAFVAITVVLGLWLLLVIRQVADGGFYSDDWGIQRDWDEQGYFEAVSRQFDTLGSKPLLAIALHTPYELFGPNPTWHHLLAVTLVLATAVTFFFVLRALRFPVRDAVPIALLALLFPWASGVRLWPTGSLNNLAVLLLFAGFLIAVRGLKVGGRRGFAIHLMAAACYAASILTYEVTTAVALFAWTSYVWLEGWRPAWPRALIDVSAVAAAAIYSAETTVKPIESISSQVEHSFDILREGADLIAASILPLELPAEVPAALTIVVVGSAAAVLAAAALHRDPSAESGDSRPGLRWAVVAAVALAALALCWSIYIPQAFYTPTFVGLEDRVNTLALYPAVVLVWAVLRAAGSLVGSRGYALAIAGATAIALGYWINDSREERDWARGAELEESVLAAIDRASPVDGSLVLTFGHPGEVAPGVPVFNTFYDLYPAARLRTGREIETYPVFEGARLRCSPKGVAVEFLPTPLYDVISLRPWGTPKLHAYSQVVFVDVANDRSAVIRSPEQCATALHEFKPGPWLDATGS